MGVPPPGTLCAAALRMHTDTCLLDPINASATILMQLLMVQAKNAAPDLSQLPDPSELFGKAKGAADDVSGKAKGAADQASGSAKGAAEQAKGSASGAVNKVSHQLHHTVV